MLRALISRADELRDVEIIHLHTEDTAEYADAAYRSGFRVTNLFVGSNMRNKLDYDKIDYLPCFLSEIPELFRSKVRSIDVALLPLSPPDKNGFCTLGTSVDVANLYGKTLGERAQALISIAHPSKRDELLREWRRE